MLKKGPDYSVPSRQFLTSQAGARVDRAICPHFHVTGYLRKNVFGTDV